MNRTLLIITGASRGLGAALAAQAVARGCRVLAISRGAAAHGNPLPLDLSDPPAIEAAVAAPFAALAAVGFTHCVLVNNAATVEPIGSAPAIEASDRHLRLNLLAPIALTRLFLQQFTDPASHRQIVNLSSGAAQRPIAGWSLYCASKAGLEHFARCVAREQQATANPADIVNVSPGVLDTEMQAAIRRSDDPTFSDRPRFIELHAQGRLASPDEVAGKLLQGVLARHRFAGASVDIDGFVKGNR